VESEIANPRNSSILFLPLAPVAAPPADRGMPEDEARRDGDREDRGKREKQEDDRRPEDLIERRQDEGCASALPAPRRSINRRTLLIRHTDTVSEVGASSPTLPPLETQLKHSL